VGSKSPATPPKFRREKMAINGQTFRKWDDIAIFLYQRLYSKASYYAGILKKYGDYQEAKDLLQELLLSVWEELTRSAVKLKAGEPVSDEFRSLWENFSEKRFLLYAYKLLGCIFKKRLRLLVKRREKLLKEGHNILKLVREGRLKSYNNDNGEDEPTVEPPDDNVIEPVFEAIVKEEITIFLRYVIPTIVEKSGNKLSSFTKIVGDYISFKLEYFERNGIPLTSIRPEDWGFPRKGRGKCEFSEYATKRLNIRDDNFRQMWSRFKQQLCAVCKVSDEVIKFSIHFVCNFVFNLKTEVCHEN